MEEGIQQFQQLKPFCVSLMNQKDRSALARLCDEITTMSSISSSLLEYLLFPLRITLQKCVRSDDSLLEAALLCVGVVLSKTRVSSEGTFHELLSMLCLMLDSRTPPEGSKLVEFGGCGLKSEEMIYAVLIVMRDLLLHSTSSVMMSLQSNLPSLGHAVSVIINIIDNDSYGRQCIINGIHTLISLTCTDSTLWKHSIATGSDISNIGKGSGAASFTSFLPGIVICLGKLATSSVLIGKDMIMLCVLGWSHYVAMVMGDAVDETTPTLTSSTADDRLSIKRSKEWLKETDGHLGKLSSRIAGLVQHDSWQIRLSLCVWASTILNYCYSSLSVAMGPVIEAIVSLSTDEYSTVALAANNILGDFVNIIESSGVSDISCLLEEKLYKLVNELPRIMRGADESKKVIVLRLLQGYLTILGSHVYHMTSSIEYVSRILQSLAQTVELDNLSLIITERKEVWHDKEDDIWTPPISYAHIREESTVTVIQSICSLIGQYGHFECVIDYTLQQIISTSRLREELLLIMHWMLQGAQLNAPLGNVLSVLLSITEEEQSLSEYSISFVLNIFGDCSRILQKQFITHLQYVIIIVLENIVNGSVLVSNTALLIARQICQYMEYSNLHHLISECADYLVDHVTLSFIHYNSLTSRGFHVLQAVLMSGSYSVLSIMIDCIEALLILLDQWYGIKQCWTVIHSLARKLQEWIKHETNCAATPSLSSATPSLSSVTPSLSDVDKVDNINDIAAFFLNHHKQKKSQRSPDHQSCDEEEQSCDEEQQCNRDDQTTPPAIQCAINIMQRCVHHLSSSDELIRLQILDCLQLTMAALEGVDEKVYLPVVHNVWSSFVHRLTDIHLPSRTKAVHVLCTMVELCGAFLRKRVIEEVWPRLMQTLQELVPIARDRSNSFTNTLQYKLLTAIITEIPQLCNKLDAGPGDCESMIHCITPYMQINSMQLLCVDTLILLAKYNGDLMWLIMIQLIPEQLPYYTPLTCKTIKLPLCVMEERLQELIKTILIQCNNDD